VLLFSVTRCIPVKRTGLDGSEKDTYVGTFEKLALNVEVTTSCPYTCTYTYACSPLVIGCISDAVQKIHCLSLVDLRDQLITCGKRMVCLCCVGGRGCCQCWLWSKQTQLCYQDILCASKVQSLHFPDDWRRTTGYIL